MDFSVQSSLPPTCCMHITTIAINFVFQSSCSIQYDYNCSTHPRNLRNLRIRKLCANLKTVQYVARSRECTSTICKRNRLTWWERLNWLTEEGCDLWDGDALNRGTRQVWDLSATIPRLRRREFLWVCKLPRSPWHEGFEYMANADGDDGAARAP